MDDVDVLVVGAGIMGVASAYHIVRNSPRKKVLLVDRYGAPGQGNTGRSNAMFRNTFSSADNQTLADSSIDYYLHLQAAGQDIGLEQIGYLWLMSEAKLSSNERYLAGMERNGIEIKRQGLRELAGALPGLRADGGEESGLLGLPKVEWGVFGPKCGRLDPDKLVRYYAGEFERLGGRIALGTEAESIDPGPTRRLGIDGEPFVWQDWRVEGVKLTGRMDRVVRPEAVVLACGAWGNELLLPIGVDGHVRAKKRQLFSLSARGNAELMRLLRTPGFNALGLLPFVILPKASVYFKPLEEEDAFWVGCEDEVNRQFIDLPDHDLDKYAAEPGYYDRGIKPVLSGYFPVFTKAELKAMWAGLYSYNTADYLPFAFRESNLIVVGGDSGSGIMKGDSLGRVVDALYREEKEAELYGGAPYDASRISFSRRRVEREEWVI